MPQNRFSGRFSVLQKVQSITLGNTCSGQKEMFHKQLGYLIKMTAARDWLQSGIPAFSRTFLAGIPFRVPSGAIAASAGALGLQPLQCPTEDNKSE
jgi:hypothetical protein